MLHSLLRFLKNPDDSFMEQVLREATEKDALLDLLLVNRDDLVSEAEIGSCLSHGDQEEIEFKISVNRRKSAGKTSALDMKRARFRHLRQLVRSPGNVFLQMLESISSGHFINITS